MQVVHWQKALILWFQDKVEILEYHTLFARSANDNYQIPSVLRLKNYIRHQHKTRIRFSRENVYIRDHHCCQYCGVKYEKKELTLDHVVPASKGGPKSWQNVVTACRPCNQKKANRTPEQAKMPLLKIPDQPRWLPNPELTVGKTTAPEVWSPYLVNHAARAKQIARTF